jgi:uncharacterized protein YkwD
MGVKLFGALIAAAAISFGALALIAASDDSSPPDLTLSYSEDSNLALAAETALQDEQDTPSSDERQVARPTSSPTPAQTPIPAPTTTPTAEVIEEATEAATEASATGPIADAAQSEEEEDEKKAKEGDENEPLAAATAASTPTEEPEAEPQPTDNSWSGNEQQMLDRHNQARSGEGVSSLSPDSDLKAMAEYRCQQLGSNFSHDGFRPALSKFGISYSVAGENLATIGSVGAAFNAWMASPGHRANILESSFDRVGIAYCEVGGQSYWVVDFAG